MVTGPAGAQRDLRVVAEGDAPARQLFAALAAEVGAPETAATRQGDELPWDAPVAELALRHGDEIRLDEADADKPRGTAELVVLGGLDSGRRIPLGSGTHRIGRSAEVSLDDPALSSEHLVLTIAEDGSATVADAGSRNGTLVEGVSLAEGEERELRTGEIVQAGRTLLGVTAPDGGPPDHGARASERARFNRPPRVQRPLEETVRPFAAPPTDPQRSRLPLGASLIPLALGVTLYLWTKLPTMLLFSLLSPVMAVSTYIEDRRSGRKGFERARRSYREQLVSLADELGAERREEAARRRAAFPAAVELIRRARRLESNLWDRRLDDPDFLELRVGSAEQPSLLHVRLEPGGSEELRREVDELAAWYASVPAVPVTVKAAELGVVGLCGPRERVESLARWLVAQAAALHSPRDLAISAVLDPRHADGWDWLKWLPHVSPAGEGRLATDADGVRSVLDEIARLVSGRRLEAESAFGPASRRERPHVLLVLDETIAPERALVAEVLAGAGEHGVSVLWLGRERRHLPGETGAIVELAPESARLTLVDARAGVETADVTADGLSPERARELALALAPVEDDEAGVGGGAVPSSVDLLELLGEGEIDAGRVAARWRTRSGGLGAIVGMAANGPFSIDLRADGPHGLVAGMTGAGKSELLQTLIASLAISHPPDRLAFLLVDYKGGAAFKDCVDLPHTVGLVTDLDAHLTQRALASLNAELQRRERVLRDAGAKDLADLEARDPASAPPSLLIAIDEFATLAREVPDFVEGIVDVAQRGRSLGVHLLLATQRPGGVVSENIRANTNLRIALRVNEPAESTDVIGVPDAARISRARPGRIYARTGHGELTEVQAGYAGRPVDEAAGSGPAILVEPFTLGETHAERRSDEAEAGRTELTLIVAATAEAARREADRPAGVSVARPASGGARPRGHRVWPRHDRRAAAAAATPARARPGRGGQRPRLRRERRRQDGVPAHARARTRRAAVAG